MKIKSGGNIYKLNQRFIILFFIQNLFHFISARTVATHMGVNSYGLHVNFRWIFLNSVQLCAF